MSNLEKRKDAVKGLLHTAFNSNLPIAFKRVEMSRLMDAKGYIQHSPGIDNGLESLLLLIADLDKDSPGYGVEVKRVIAEGDLVFAHCHYTYGVQDPHGKAIAEIFRFDGDLIVEHWDVIQDVTTESRNGHSMF
tara:strand:+ start:1241 stop:1642 length:402 start_codon:yes stop_codon:yes gene_type:complete